MHRRSKICIIIVIAVLGILFVFYNDFIDMASKTSSTDSVEVLNTSSGMFTTYGTNNYTRQNHYFIKETKTTSGWPFLKNDVYNTLGIVVTSASWDGRSGWYVGFEAVDLSSSRTNGSTKSSYAIKSQSIIENGTYVSELYGPGQITMGSWPHRFIKDVNWKGNASDIDVQLIKNTINTTYYSGPFPLSQSELINNLTCGTDSNNQFSNELLNSRRKGEYRDGWYWDYANLPWENKPDSAAIATWRCNIPFGSTFEFDVIGTTYSGLFEKSITIAHVKVTVPPDPTLMDKSQLKENRITAWVSNATFVTQTSGNKMNISYVEGEPHIVGYGTSNISVEIS